MRFKPEAHDFVVQPDGRVFHVVPSAWSGGQTAYRVEYQERIVRHEVALVEWG